MINNRYTEIKELNANADYNVLGYRTKHGNVTDLSIYKNSI